MVLDLEGRTSRLRDHVTLEQKKLKDWQSMIDSFKQSIDELEEPIAYEVTSEKGTVRRSAYQVRMMELHGIKI